MSCFTSGFDFDYDDHDPMDSGVEFEPVMSIDEEIDAHREMRAEERMEAERQARIDAGIEHQCVVCGGSESTFPAGCVWAAPNLCSRCAAPTRNAFYGG